MLGMHCCFKASLLVPSNSWNLSCTEDAPGLTVDRMFMTGIEKGQRLAGGDAGDKARQDVCASFWSDKEEKARFHLQGSWGEFISRRQLSGQWAYL